MPPPPSSSPLKIGLKPPLGTPRKLKFGIKCYFNPTKRNMKKNITPPPPPTLFTLGLIPHVAMLHGLISSLFRK